MKTGKPRVFKWSQRYNWQRVFLHLLADKINEAVIAEARRINPRYLGDDNFAWLNSAVATVTKQSPKEIPLLLAKRLSNHYKFIIAFHGTRADSAEDFLEHGINVSDTDVLELQAIQRFGNSDALQNAIVELRSSSYAEHNQGKIYLSLTKEPFLKECKAYLLEGSEYIAAVAYRLRRTEKLGILGKPLIVECLIPAGILAAEFWRGRSYAMLEDYFKRVLRPLEKQRVEPSYVVITQSIPAENILRVHEFAEAKRRFQGYNLLTGLPEESVETILQPLKIWRGKEKP